MILLSMTIFLIGGGCGLLLGIKTTPDLDSTTSLESLSTSDTLFDFWLKETLIEAEINASYDEETNSVYLGEKITVFFDLETDKFAGIGMDFGPIDVQNLTSTQKEQLDYHRSQFVLSEIEKLFGTDSVKFQNVAKVLEDTQAS